MDGQVAKPVVKDANATIGQLEMHEGILVK